jgi:polyphosphate kinase
MQRILEPELMEDDVQVKAYAEADFETPHNHFMQLVIEQLNDPGFSGIALDLGCGPGDISVRFARAFPQCSIHAVDGSQQMLKYARRALAEELHQRVEFLYAYLPHDDLPLAAYDIIFSNSLLHHLAEPQILWGTIKKYATTGTRVFIMDLLRPENVSMARSMVQDYAAGEAEVLQRDFFNSLLAAFTVDEIGQQLKQADLSLTVKQISDRHCLIYTPSDMSAL